MLRSISNLFKSLTEFTQLDDTIVVNVRLHQMRDNTFNLDTHRFVGDDNWR